ncbi:MAG: hypothetical protein AABY33_08240 [Pseudomonadota bacterium]
MNRITFAAIWVSVIVVASFMLYRVKYEVQALKAQIVQVSLEMEQERELLHVEAAEWSYLTRPDNLEKMADKYLGGKSVTVEQVAEVAAIAFPEQSVASVDTNSDTRTVPASYRNSYAHR